jgi:hypothetical protein
MNRGGWPASDRVLEVLEDVARRREIVTYSELGRRVGLPTRGRHWKAILDDISLKRRKGTPDLSFLVVSKTTLLPAFEGVNSKTVDVVGRVVREQEACWNYYQKR